MYIIYHRDKIVLYRTQVPVVSDVSTKQYYSTKCFQHTGVYYCAHDEKEQIKKKKKQSYNIIVTFELD